MNISQEHNVCGSDDSGIYMYVLTLVLVIVVHRQIMHLIVHVLLLDFPFQENPSVFHCNITCILYIYIYMYILSNGRLNRMGE